MTARIPIADLSRAENTQWDEHSVPQVRVWQVGESVGYGETISLQWESKTDDNGSLEPSLALPDSILTTIAIWSTDR